MNGIYFEKKSLLFALSAASIFLSSCSIINSEGVKLVVTSSAWTASIDQGGFGTVSLHIKGTTNADKVTIETYGDGMIDETELKISDYSFDQTVVIAFTHSPNLAPRKYATKLTASENSESKDLTITSDDLIFQ